MLVRIAGVAAVVSALEALHGSVTAATMGRGLQL